MKTIITTFWRQIAIAGLSAGSACAQGAINFDFRSLPPGQVVGEQFAPLGVHFLQVGFFDPLMTASAPSFFDPAAATVGYAKAFRIKFDQPVTLFSFDVGQEKPYPGSSGGAWALTTYDLQGAILSQPKSGYFSHETRNVAVATFPSDAGVQILVFQSYWLYPGEVFTQPSFIDNISVTMVPEPSSILLLAFGGVLIGLFSARTRPARKRSPGMHT